MRLLAADFDNLRYWVTLYASEFSKEQRPLLLADFIIWAKQKVTTDDADAREPVKRSVTRAE